MLKSAGHAMAQPPGWVALADAPGTRYLPPIVSQRPTPAVIRTAEIPGSHASWGTRTSNCLRFMSTVAVGAGAMGFPVAAWVSTAVVPWTVRKACAGDETPALKGQLSEVADLPRAIVKATLDGSLSEFSVTRKAVADRSGLTRSSTRSAALFP